MGLVSKEQAEVAKFLLPDVVELAKEHDGLTEPDKGTQQIMLRCIGVGLCLGEAYNQTSTTLPWRARISEAFEIVGKSKP